MNTRKLESMIRNAIENAIWDYEYKTKEKIEDHVEINATVTFGNGEARIYVDADEKEDNY